MQKAIKVLVTTETREENNELNKYLEEGWKVVSHTSLSISHGGWGVFLVIIEKENETK